MGGAEREADEKDVLRIDLRHRLEYGHRRQSVIAAARSVLNGCFFSIQFGAHALRFVTRSEGIHDQDPGAPDHVNEFLRRARELAASGHYSGYEQIVHVLRREGYAKARVWLEDDLLRSELDQICAESRKDDRRDDLIWSPK